MVYGITLLYKWFMMHISTRGPFVNTVEPSLWAPRIMGLTSYDIVWNNMGILKEFVTSYGEFPNVPLIGTKVCINYNPILVRRRFGFVITNGPTEREVKETVYFNKGGDAVMFERVKVSWKHIHRK